MVVCQFNDYTWELFPDTGKLVGFRTDDGVKAYEFYIGNPPARGTENHKLFLIVCGIAEHMDLLRRIDCFAVVR